MKKRFTRAAAILFIVLLLIQASSFVSADDNGSGTGTNNSVANLGDPTDNPSDQSSGLNGNKGDKSVVREVKEKRTKDSKHYLLADGSYQAIISMGNVHYEDEYGELQDIKTDLIDEADIDLVDVPVSKEVAVEVKLIKQENKEKRKHNQIDKSQTDFRALQLPFDVKIPKKFSKGYSMGKGSDKLTFKPVGSSNASAVMSSDKKNRVTYENVWNQTDVTLDLTNNGVKETLILKTVAAPTMFSFEVEGPLADDLTVGGLKIMPAWLQDAEGTKRDVLQTIRKSGSKTFIDLTASLDNLVYPIEIDPTITLAYSSAAAAIRSYSLVYPPDTTTQFSNYPGYAQRSYDYINLKYQIDLTTISWNTSSIPDDAVVTEASLSLGYFSYSGNNRYLNLEWFTGSIDSTMYTSGDSSTAGSAPLSSVPDSFKIVNALSLANAAANINKSGNTTIRFTISGGQPTQGNYALLNQINDYFKLTISYNILPTAPIVTAPNGGETLFGSHEITWTPATDTDTPQANLRYHIQVSTNGGSAWSDVVALTTAGVTSYTYDFSPITESTSSLIRIRAYDGTSYGPWDQSNGVFTIQHNIAPNAPTNLTPGSASASTPTLTAGTTPILNWTFTDPDAGDTQTQYEVVVYNTVTSSIVHDSGWVSSSSNSYTVPSGILLRNTKYNWQVKIKDNRGGVSIYSPFSYIKINNLPVASMTSYTDGQQINTNILNFTWTYSDTDAQTQSNYQIVGSKDNWLTWAYNSGETTSSATAFTTPRLAEGEWDFGVRVKDGFEWSDWSYRNNVTLPNSYEPNDTNLTAFPILYSTQYTSIIESATDVDFYSYNAASTGIDQFNLTVPAGKNYEVYVYNSTMNLVALSGNGTGINEKIIYDVTGGQTYFIKIVGVNGDFSTSTNYAFQLLQHVVNYQTTYQYDSNGNMTSKTTTIVQP